MLYIPDVCIRVLWTSDRHGRTNLSLKDLRYDTNSIIYAQNNPEYGVSNIRGPGIRTGLNAMQYNAMSMQFSLETLKTPNRRNFKTNPIKGMSELHVNIYTKKLSLSAALLGNMSLTV